MNLSYKKIYRLRVPETAIEPPALPFNTSYLASYALPYNNSLVCLARDIPYNAQDQRAWVTLLQSKNGLIACSDFFLSVGSLLVSIKWLECLE